MNALVKPESQRRIIVGHAIKEAASASEALASSEKEEDPIPANHPLAQNKERDHL